MNSACDLSASAGIGLSGTGRAGACRCGLMQGAGSCDCPLQDLDASQCSQSFDTTKARTVIGALGGRPEERPGDSWRDLDSQVNYCLDRQNETGDVAYSVRDPGRTGNFRPAFIHQPPHVHLSFGRVMELG